jgi:hypothetical protein
MSIGKFFAHLRSKYKQPSVGELARASYGPEPYGVAAEIDVWERFEAAVTNNVKYLLTYVLGSSVVKALSEEQYPYAFRHALPTSSKEIVECVRRDGLPKWLARYSQPAGSGFWIHEGTAGSWVTSEVDERNFRFDHKFLSKWEAEKYVVDFYISWTKRYWVDTYRPYA